MLGVMGRVMLPIHVMYVYTGLQVQLVNIQSQLSSLQLKYEREKMRHKILHNNLVVCVGYHDNTAMINVICT